MSKLFLIFVAPLIALSTVAALPVTVAAQQQNGQQAQKEDQPGPGRFFRRIRDELRGNEDKAEQQRKEQLAKEREQASREQQARVPTPAQRPGVTPYQGRYDGVRMPSPETAQNLAGPTSARMFDGDSPGTLPTPAAHTNQPAPTPAAQGDGFGMSLTDDKGAVVVRDILRNGNAQSAGIRRGDVVQSVGGVPVKSASEFDEIAGVMSAGDQIELEIVRGKKEEKILLQYGAPAHPETGAELASDGNTLSGPPIVSAGSAPDFVPNDRSPMGGVIGTGVVSSQSVVEAPDMNAHNPIVANQAQTIVRLQQTVQQQQEMINQLQQQLQAVQNSNRRRN